MEKLCSFAVDSATLRTCVVQKGRDNHLYALQSVGLVWKQLLNVSSFWGSARVRPHWYLELEGRHTFPGCVTKYIGHKVGLEQGRAVSDDTAARTRKDWCYVLSFSVLHTVAFRHSCSLNLNWRVSSHGLHREMCQEREGGGKKVGDLADLLSSKSKFSLCILMLSSKLHSKLFQILWTKLMQ